MALPDLVISDLQINPNNQYEDYPDTINITVQNQGDEIAYLVFVDLFYNIDHSPSPGYDISDDFDWVDEIVPGGSANFSITAYYDEFWTYTFGQFNVYAYVDFDEFIDEDNEGNNVYGPVELGWIQDPTVENYLWPIDPDNAPHNLSSVVNEYREEGGLHTHKGIDIPADDGTNVYSVSSGQVKDLT
jgi:murein DD-endopeptidase MepM/ murein hydrolase activator NlpD